METNVKTPLVIFNLPQRLLVPLFQRPYVWNQENQWAPLWQDVERIADKVLTGDHEASHFLGAVVLQQESNATGTMLTRTIIDGQQRLTTLQVLFDAIHEEVMRLGLGDVAKRIRDLVENPEYQRRQPEDQFKVWPTNRDREAFASVMSTPMPDHKKLPHSKERLVHAHEYFSGQARAWLNADPERAAVRAATLVDAVSTRLQLVVIDLKPNEDAQEIFETLNARGTPLTAADLIKNLVFQRLNATPAEAEKAYVKYWKRFETPFWEAEISSGRVLWSRSSLFLTQWLTSRTQADIPARAVFTSFKRYIEDSGVPVATTLGHIRACADVFEETVTGSEDQHKPLTFQERFTYRTMVLESEAVRPVVIWLTDPSLPPVPVAELEKALASLECWLVRRTLVKERSAGANRFFVDLLAELAGTDREAAGTRIEKVLSNQTSDVSYWPDDQAVRSALTTMPVFTKLSRGRLRMVLEAIEDHRRGFPGASAKGEQPVVRGRCTIEHVLPQRWEQHWPLPEGVTTLDRDALVHTLGNLTLVSQSLNPSLSNGSWVAKRAALAQYSSIKLTADAVARADATGGDWDEAVIAARTEAMIDDILAIWPVPNGHTNAGRHAGAPKTRTTIADLLRAGLLNPGDVLVPGSPAYADARAVVTAEGSLDVGGRLRTTPSGAGKVVTGGSIQGWTFWRVGRPDGPLLNELRSAYLALTEQSADDD